MTSLGIDEYWKSNKDQEKNESKAIRIVDTDLS